MLLSDSQKYLCVCVSLRDVTAVLLQEEGGEFVKDWLTVQRHKLFPTDLGGGGHREKHSELKKENYEDLSFPRQKMFRITPTTNIINTFNPVPKVRCI